MKTVFETAECEEVRSSIFSVQRHERHENRMKGCYVEQKVSSDVSPCPCPQGLLKDQNEVLVLEEKSWSWSLALKSLLTSLKVSDWQMSVWISWACDAVKARRGIIWQMTGM